MKGLSLVALLVLTQAQRPANVTGTWLWQGSAGWQRIELSLKSDGSKLTGVMTMGPGSHEPASSAGFWEYFFDPLDFRISNGSITGTSISFEQSAYQLSTSGARPTQIRFIYTGVVNGDRIHMTREIVAGESEKKNLWQLGSHKVNFVLEKVE